MILEIKNGCFGYPKQDIILSDIRCIRRILFSSCQGKLQRSVCEEGISIIPVSYTHLTLPTILRV